MEKVVLLKTQLAEAAHFARSKRFSHKRLAVILLDNFVEIQLSGLMREKFSLADELYFKEKKYSHENQVKILNHYDELLRICVKEDIINTDEKRLLTYCHDIRNNLYHKGDEEVLLTKIAIVILNKIILKHQPKWKTTRKFTIWTHDSHDPYNPKKGYSSLSSENSDEDWNNFLNKHFVCIDKRTKNASGLLSDYLIEKIKSTRDAIKFINQDYKIFFPSAKDWGYSDFLLHYSFLNVEQNELKKIKEIKDRTERQQKYDILFLSYKNSWRHKKQSRLKTLEKAFKQLAKLPIEKSIEKFVTYKDETNMLHAAFGRAALELDIAIQDAVDFARGK
jgi:hypothetical protein